MGSKHNKRPDCLTCKVSFKVRKHKSKGLCVNCYAAINRKHVDVSKMVKNCVVCAKPFTMNNTETRINGGTKKW